MFAEHTLEWALRRQQITVAGALAVLVALSWAYLLTGAGMSMPAAGAAPATAWEMAARGVHAAAWTPGHALIVFFMWAVMMVAMMVPSAAPTILLFARMQRARAERAPGATGTFVAGYVAAWAGFSLAATAIQYALEQTGQLSPMMAANGRLLAGSIVVAAGLYQLTPLKNACLRHCRSPIAFIMHHWRPGRRGALRVGVEHGAFCLGCCWVLMALLFVGGVMNMIWIAGLTLLVLAEKILPRGYFVAKCIGVVLTAAGVVILLA